MMIEAATLALPGIRHGFFTREGGISDGLYASLNGGLGSRDTDDRVAENRTRMAGALAVKPACLLTAYQTHSRDVIVADAAWPPQARPRGDAVVTRTPGLAVGVTTAECGPILLADAQARVIGAAHAGWRGALGGIIEATLDAMEKLGADRNRIRAALGPMIRQPNYEVGSDLIARFTAEDAASGRFFCPASRDGHALFDLAGYIATRLARAGIRQFEDLGYCTYADTARFFSFRRSTHRGEGDYGRHVNAIVLG
jgi:polyphenol oxidase